MLHSSMNKELNYEREDKYDYNGKNYSHCSLKKFYVIDDLQSDGFIFPDGSLRFKFFIKK